MKMGEQIQKFVYSQNSWEFPWEFGRPKTQRYKN